jgi:predicted nucleic acid-binding protein
MKVVVDANVWLAASRPQEQSHSEAAAFLREAIVQGIEFTQPTLVLAEVAATAARSSRETKDGQDARLRLEEAPGVEFFELTRERAIAAAELASRAFLKGPDSIYGSLAEEFGAELVTLDLELHERIGQQLTVLSPSEWLVRHAPASPKGAEDVPR